MPSVGNAGSSVKKMGKVSASVGVAVFLCYIAPRLPEEKWVKHGMVPSSWNLCPSLCGWSRCESAAAVADIRFGIAGCSLHAPPRACTATAHMHGTVFESAWRLPYTRRTTTSCMWRNAREYKRYRWTVFSRRAHHRCAAHNATANTPADKHA